MRKRSVYDRAAACRVGSVGPPGGRLGRRAEIPGAAVRRGRVGQRPSESRIGPAWPQGADGQYAPVRQQAVLACTRGGSRLSPRAAVCSGRMGQRSSESRIGPAWPPGANGQYAPVRKQAVLACSESRIGPAWPPGANGQYEPVKEKAVLASTGPCHRRTGRECPTRARMSRREEPGRAEHVRARVRQDAARRAETDGAWASPRQKTKVLTIEPGKTTRDSGAQAASSGGETTEGPGPPASSGAGPSYSITHVGEPARAAHARGAQQAAGSSGKPTEGPGPPAYSGTGPSYTITLVGEPARAANARGAQQAAGGSSKPTEGPGPPA